MSPRSVGLDLDPAGACSAEMPLEFTASAFEFSGTSVGLAPGAHSAIIFERKLVVLSLRAAFSDSSLQPEDLSRFFVGPV